MISERILAIGYKYPDQLEAIVEYFNNLEDKDHRSIYSLTAEYLLELYKDHGKLPDLELLKSDIPGFDIEHEDVNVEYFLKEYKESLHAEFLTKIIDQSEKHALSLEFIQKEWDKITPKKKDGSQSVVSSDSDVYSILKQIEDTSDVRISSGYSLLDSQLTPSHMGQKVSGGFAPGYSYLWTGITGSFKTYILINFAVNQITLGRKVLYISMEMNDIQIHERLLRAFYQAKNIQEIKDALNSSHKGRMKGLTVDHRSNMSISCNDIQKIIDNMKEKPEIIIIDYLDNLLPSRKYQQSWESHQIISSDLARLAQVNNCPVITATQSNRNAANDKGTGTKEFVGYDTIGSSYGKTHQFAGIWAILRQDCDSDDNTSLFQFQCLKNRDGIQGITNYSIDFTTAKITELTGMKRVVAEMKTKKQHKKQTPEEKTETLNNFEIYFNKLKENDTWKTDIEDISDTILNKDERKALKDQIHMWRIQQNLEPRRGK